MPDGPTRKQRQANVSQREQYRKMAGRLSSAQDHERTDPPTLANEHTSITITPRLDPQWLSAMDKVVPGFAERFVAEWLSDWREESKTRRKREEAARESEDGRSRMGLIFAFITTILGITAAVSLAITGHDGAAGVIGLGGIGGLAGIFVYGSKSQATELRGNARIIADGIKRLAGRQRDENEDDDA